MPVRLSVPPGLIPFVVRDHRSLHLGENLGLTAARAPLSKVYIGMTDVLYSPGNSAEPRDRAFPRTLCIAPCANLRTSFHAPRAGEFRAEMRGHVSLRIHMTLHNASPIPPVNAAAFS